MDALTSCKLFNGIPLQKVLLIKEKTRAVEYTYGNGEIIIQQGASSEHIGIVLFGEIEAAHYRSDGTYTIIATLGRGDVFADFLAADGDVHSPATVYANGACRVLMIPFDSLYSHLPGLENEQRVLLLNLSKIYAEKYFELKDRLVCVSAPSLRTKILSYLNLMSEKAQSNIFTVPLNREMLANYLSVDRSALSRELSKMKREGIIEYYRNSFKLKNDNV